jgi:hypothetical protein
MARYRGFGFCCESDMVSIKLIFAGCLLGLWSGTLSAQDAPIPQDEPIHTLHVYANLVQIPTLVLEPNRERIRKPIAEGRFSISIDGGPWFRATHARQEGDDSISLSVLLDLRGDVVELMPKISNAISALAPLSLHPKDHVSIYALDCSLVQSSNDVSVDKEELKAAVDKALHPWMDRRQKVEPNCVQPVHLWDAMAHITSDLYKLPGRRVILLVSDGKDKDSNRSWDDVSTYAHAAGVSVFGMTNELQNQIGTNRVSPWLGVENSYQSMCEWNGGIVLLTSVKSLGETLKRFTSMLRERYIVEFPRPANITLGHHGVVVKIAKGDSDFIRAAGVSVKLPDSAALADPTTIPSATHTPELGNHRPTTKPR